MEGGKENEELHDICMGTARMIYLIMVVILIFTEWRRSYMTRYGNVKEAVKEMARKYSRA
ncbi:MAG: hypothetical protein ACLRSW_04995 [Christensenellaceae bacterium]